MTEILATEPPYTIRPLRGRVAIREIAPERAGIIYLYDTLDSHRLGIKAMASHKGTVVAFGPPAFSADGVHEVPYEFAVGDVVQFVWSHNADNFTKLWTDGKPVCWVEQEAVLGVWE